MPHKQVQCSSSTKTMRSDNLKRHKVVCSSKRQKVDDDIVRSAENENANQQLIEIHPVKNENATKEAAASEERLCDKKMESGLLTILLKWDGKCWKIINKDYIRYQLNLGRDLVSLLRKGAIKEDVLNSKQKELIKMYSDLLE